MRNREDKISIWLSGGGECVWERVCNRRKLRHVEGPTYDHRAGHTEQRWNHNLPLSFWKTSVYSTYSEIHSAGPRVTWEARTETPNCLQVVEQFTIWTRCLTDNIYAGISFICICDCAKNRLRCSILPSPSGGVLRWQVRCSSPLQEESPRLVSPCRIQIAETPHPTFCTRGRRGGSFLHQPPRHKSPAWNTWGAGDTEERDIRPQRVNDTAAKLHKGQQWWHNTEQSWHSTRLETPQSPN